MSPVAEQYHKVSGETVMLTATKHITDSLMLVCNVLQLQRSKVCMYVLRMLIIA